MCLLNELENDAAALIALRTNAEIPLILSLWNAYISPERVTLRRFAAVVS
jgi:hypothetical protein